MPLIMGTSKIICSLFLKERLPLTNPKIATPQEKKWKLKELMKL
jgi:hypothetical protein